MHSRRDKLMQISRIKVPKRMRNISKTQHTDTSDFWFILFFVWKEKTTSLPKRINCIQEWNESHALQLFPFYLHFYSNAQFTIPNRSSDLYIYFLFSFLCFPMLKCIYQSRTTFCSVLSIFSLFVTLATK